MSPERGTGLRVTDLHAKRHEILGPRLEYFASNEIGQIWEFSNKGVFFYCRYQLFPIILLSIRLCYCKNREGRPWKCRKVPSEHEHLAQLKMSPREQLRFLHSCKKQSLTATPCRILLLVTFSLELYIYFPVTMRCLCAVAQYILPFSLLKLFSTIGTEVQTRQWHDKIQIPYEQHHTCKFLSWQGEYPTTTRIVKASRWT